MEKKKYIEPELTVEEIEVEDIIASSGLFGGNKPGDKEDPFPWSR